MSDIEALADQTSPLFNDAVRFVLWENVTVTIKDRQSKRPKDILNNVCGLVQAGELLAIMGPSYVRIYKSLTKIESTDTVTQRFGEIHPVEQARVQACASKFDCGR